MTTINKIIKYKDLEIEVKDNYVNGTVIQNYFKNKNINATRISHFVDTPLSLNLILYLAGEKNNINNFELNKHKEKYVRDNDYFGYRIVPFNKKVSYIHYEIFKLYAYACDIEFGIFISNINFLESNNEKDITRTLIKKDKSEHEISKDIKYLLDLMIENNKIEIEQSFINTLDNNSITRRVDFIINKEEVVEIFELKRDNINLEMVTKLICEKKYLKLASIHYNKPSTLNFISLKDITEEAKELLEYIPNINFIKVQDFLEDNYNYALNNKWVKNKKEIKRIILEEGYSYLFNETFIKSLVQ